MIRSLYVKSPSVASTSSTTFWWALQTLTEWIEPAIFEHTIWVSRHRTLKTQSLHLSIFLWKQYKILASSKTFASCKVFIYVLLYSHVCLFKNLPTEIIISKNVWWSVSVVLTFPFLGAGFANISPTFLISCEVQTKYSKMLKYSEQYIQDHLSGTKIRI